MQKYYGVKWTLIKAPIKSRVLLYSSVSQSEIPSHPQRQSFHSNILFLLHILWIYLISDKRCHFILLYNLIHKKQWWKVYIILLTLLCSVKKLQGWLWNTRLDSLSHKVCCNSDEYPRPPSLWCVYDPPPMEGDKSKPKRTRAVS